MDETSRRQVAAHIAEVQRCFGNLHSMVHNFVNQRYVTGNNINLDLDQQVSHIQNELRAAAAHLKH